MTTRDPYLLVNTSSPDRGLRKLVDLFIRVREQVPQAKLVHAYGWGVFDVGHAGNAKVMEWKAKLIEKMENTPGITELGRISHAEVAELYKKANVFAYPSEFAEIDCISLSKAMAAGAIPATTSFAAMGDKAGHGGIFLPSAKTPASWALPYQFDFSQDDALDDAWVEAVVSLLQNPPSESDRNAMRAWAQQEFSWSRIADAWNLICSPTEE